MTLPEVFQVASGAALDGEACVDHAEEFASMEVKSLRAVLEGPGASVGQLETHGAEPSPVCGSPSDPRSRVAVTGQVDSMNESLTGCRSAGLKSSTGPCAAKAGRVDFLHPRESRANEDEGFPKPLDLLRALASEGTGEMCQGRTRAVRVPGGKILSAVVLPRVSDESDPDGYVGYEARGKDVQLSGEVVIRPPLVSAFGSRQWLEDYLPPPRSRAIQTKYRLRRH